MLCPSCNAYRPVNNGPCPQCNAPSPLVEGTGAAYQVPPAPAGWGGSTAPPPGNGWDNQVPQLSFQGETYDNTLWGQGMLQQAAPGSISQNPPSLLPVPYQGGAGEPQQSMLAMPHGSTGGKEGSLMPAIPGEEGYIYVPPMHTKPRAIIPRYRVISGLISVLVIFALLCAGTAYYANATGKLSFLHQLYGDARPNNAKSVSTPMLPLPQSAPQYGPASTIITSAATASSIDKATAQPLIQTVQFKAGDTIFLTYSVHPKKPGTVTVKWYTNKNFYEESKPIPIADAASGFVPIQFAQAVEGSVELYWNDQLAVRLFFVVEPNMP
jgi:hypothetical protein